ncbi:MAG: Asp23/Gls24 family envelope stress response protein, partial [Clostridia bacterium]|nr:Asp23/Gls24 family envelope stress response protein [Clostridia bacterium]
MNVEEKNLNTNIDKDGNISISTDVIATIAAIAAKSIDGVSGMINSLTGGFAELLGKKNPSKGVKVSINGRDVKIDMYVVVEYGVKIPDV